MKSLHLTDALLFAVACILQCQSLDAAMETEDAPSTITIDYLEELYQAVEFDHQLHTDMYQCNACHHHTTGDLPAQESCRSCHEAGKTGAELSCSGCHVIRRVIYEAATSGKAYHIDTPDFKGAMHLQCRGCHLIENGPAGCQDCHTFTPAGRKRFAMPDNAATFTDAPHTSTSASPEKNMEGE